MQWVYASYVYSILVWSLTRDHVSMRLEQTSLSFRWWITWFDWQAAWLHAQMKNNPENFHQFLHIWLLHKISCFLCWGFAMLNSLPHQVLHAHTNCNCGCAMSNWLQQDRITTQYPSLTAFTALINTDYYIVFVQPSSPHGSLAYLLFSFTVLYTNW